MLPIYKEKKKNPPKQALKENKKNSRFATSGNKFLFISLGCPRNLVDSEVMLGILLKSGYEPVPEIQEADYIVINTCGFLKESRSESLGSIQEAFDLRKKGAKVIVTGCMVQSHSQEITDIFPQVDYLLGSGDVEGILKAVQSSEPGAIISSARSYLEAGEVPRVTSTPKHYAYLKIAEGCRKRCSYCMIPDIKGPLKSKPVEQILKEFRILRKQGVEELILIAQDLGDWGKDLGYRKTEGLLFLLQEILKEPGDYWLRLLYLYPDEITDELIQLIKSDPRVCPYLDMPIQHINDTMLKSMRRTTNQRQILDTIDKLRKEICNISIRTSLIVAYPGETEEQFQELSDFVSTIKLDQVGIFKYSREPGTHADTLPGHLSEEIKEERYHLLMQRQQEALKAVHQKYIGKQLEAFVEGYHPESELLMTARHSGQCPGIDNQIIINNGTLGLVTSFGKRYMVEITGVADYDLIGSVIK